jgi:hypothetical protein
MSDKPNGGDLIRYSSNGTQPHARDTDRRIWANFFYSCFASLACFARARLLMSFCSACTYDRTILGGASVIAAPTNAWVQYGVIVPGASFVSTERTKDFGFGMNNDGRRILDMADVCGDERTRLTKSERITIKRGDARQSTCLRARP